MGTGAECLDTLMAHRLGQLIRQTDVLTLQALLSTGMVTDKGRLVIAQMLAKDFARDGEVSILEYLMELDDSD